jgi:hypothetical protein
MVGKTEREDDRDWKLAVFEDVVAEQAVQERAWALANGMHEPSIHPTLSYTDLQAARRYLRQCVLNASVAELQGMTERDFAALWARGAIGACVYRGQGRSGGAAGSARSRRQR